jgi:hypothetical protein
MPNFCCFHSGLAPPASPSRPRPGAHHKRAHGAPQRSPTCAPRGARWTALTTGTACAGPNAIPLCCSTLQLYEHSQNCQATSNSPCAAVGTSNRLPTTLALRHVNMAQRPSENRVSACSHACVRRANPRDKGRHGSQKGQRRRKIAASHAQKWQRRGSSRNSKSRLNERLSLSLAHKIELVCSAVICTAAVASCAAKGASGCMPGQGTLSRMPLAKIESMSCSQPMDHHMRPPSVEVTAPLAAAAQHQPGAIAHPARARVAAASDRIAPRPRGGPAVL